MRKISWKIPYRYREIIKKNEKILLSNASMTMFAQNLNLFNFVRILTLSCTDLHGYFLGLLTNSEVKLILF